MKHLKLYENFSNNPLDINKKFKDYKYVTQVGNAIKSSLDKINIEYKLYENNIIVYDYDSSKEYITISVSKLQYIKYGRPIGSEIIVRYDIRYDIRESVQVYSLKELLQVILKRSPEYLADDVLLKINT